MCGVFKLHTLCSTLYTMLYCCFSFSAYTHACWGAGGGMFTAALSLSHTHTHMQVVGCRGISDDETIDIKLINDQ